ENCTAAATEFAVFPAPAGINRRRIYRCHCCPGVPRASGDKPGVVYIGLDALSCSPRQRG
ncbi:hypothetical protein, partial [Salmonella enterica]|uniref:hypothetical protein n=1 Tax=Salmonella enterica TaxID=28901 RepID=UPI001C38D0D6